MSDEQDSSKTTIQDWTALWNSMKGTLGLVIILVCIVFAVIMIVSPLIGTYNALVDSDLQVQRASSNVKVDLERRADLLPNLANTVKGSATFEYKTQHDTYVEVAQARGAEEAARLKSQISSVPASQAAATSLPQEQQLTQLLGNFVKLQEAYPDVKLNSVQQFREFGAQVTATENQILTDRQTYNAAVMQYKGVATSFPAVVVSKMLGYGPDKYQMWTSPNAERTQYAPNITFDDLKDL